MNVLADPNTSTLQHFNTLTLSSYELLLTIA